MVEYQSYRHDAAFYRLMLMPTSAAASNVTLYTIIAIGPYQVALHVHTSTLAMDPGLSRPSRVSRRRTWKSKEKSEAHATFVNRHFGCRCAPIA